MPAKLREKETLLKKRHELERKRDKVIKGL